MHQMMEIGDSTSNYPIPLHSDRLIATMRRSTHCIIIVPNQCRMRLFPRRSNNRNNCMKDIFLFVLYVQRRSPSQNTHLLSTTRPFRLSPFFFNHGILSSITISLSWKYWLLRISSGRKKKIIFYHYKNTQTTTTVSLILLFDSHSARHWSLIIIRRFYDEFPWHFEIAGFVLLTSCKNADHHFAFIYFAPLSPFNFYTIRPFITCDYSSHTVAMEIVMSAREEEGQGILKG